MLDKREQCILDILILSHLLCAVFIVCSFFLQYCFFCHCSILPVDVHASHVSGSIHCSSTAMRKLAQRDVFLALHVAASTEKLLSTAPGQVMHNVDHASQGRKNQVTTLILC